MKIHYFSRALWILGFCAGLFAEEPSGEEATPAPAESPYLLMSLRLDAGYTGGDPAIQGFSIPSLRVSASGHATPQLFYRASLGQTREYSSLLMPQLIPTEAFVQWDSAGQNSKRSRVAVSLGLFSPALNPWWTPDLGELPIPDYQLSHRALLLSRDIGAEILVTPFADRLELGAGLFNGSGVIGFNTNSSRAFTAFVRGGTILGNWRMTVGSGGYLLTQSDAGNLNYRRNSAVDVFLFLEWQPLSAVFYLDGFLGTFEDASAKYRPSGAAATFLFGFSWLRLFARYESLFSSPSAQGARLEVWQAGPLFWMGSTLKVFFLAQSLRLSGAQETSGLLRLRLTL